MSNTPFADCSPMSEFLIRNCMGESAPVSGLFNTGDMLVHHYPHEDHELSPEKLAELEDCHNTDRLAVTR